MPSTPTARRKPWYWFAGFALLGLSAVLLPYFALPALFSGFVLSATWIIASMVVALISIAGLAYSARQAVPEPPFQKTAKVAHQIIASFLTETEVHNTALLGRHFKPIYQPVLKDHKLIKLTELIQAIMKGNPKKVKELITKQPALLFEKYSKEITDPSGRTFMPTTAFKLMLWLKEPMRDEVLACIPKQRIDLMAQVDKQKEEFRNEGLSYTLQDEAGVTQTISQSKGYTLSPIITSLADCNDFRKTPEERSKAWVNYNKLLRDVPYWMAQLICNNAKAPFQNLRTFDKSHFRAEVAIVGLMGSDVPWFGPKSPLGIDLSINWNGKYMITPYDNSEYGNINDTLETFNRLDFMIFQDTNKFMATRSSALNEQAFPNKSP